MCNKISPSCNIPTARAQWPDWFESADRYVNTQHYTDTDRLKTIERFIRGYHTIELNCDSEMWVY